MFTVVDRIVDNALALCPSALSCYPVSKRGHRPPKWWQIVVGKMLHDFIHHFQILKKGEIISDCQKFCATRWQYL